jgi:biopolymer transport protein ExbB
MRFTKTLRHSLLALMAIFAFAAAPAFAQAPEAPKPAKEVVENPYGIEALWAQGDFVSKGTLIILAIMSMGSWYIGIVKLIEQQRLLKEGKEARQQFWLAPTIDEGSKKLGEDSAFRFLAEEGIKAATHHDGSMTDAIDLSTWIGMSLQRAYDEISDRLQGGLAFLATVGSTAPFVGLFGTVWGIYHALTAIGISGQASIDKVAGPVGEALIMTAIGLAVAVPAVLAYNWMVRRNKSALAQVRHFSSELHMVLLAGGKKGVRN